MFGVPGNREVSALFHVVQFKALTVASFILWLTQTRKSPRVTTDNQLHSQFSLSLQHLSRSFETQYDSKLQVFFSSEEWCLVVSTPAADNTWVHFSFHESEIKSHVCRQLCSTWGLPGSNFDPLNIEKGEKNPLIQTNWCQFCTITFTPVRGGRDFVLKWEGGYCCFWLIREFKQK